MFRYLIAFLLTTGAFASSIPSRSCLDDCLCEQDESNPLIRCDNGKRTTIQLPTQPMPGYEILAIPCNDVRHLPTSELLFAAFPDLKAIDVEGNPNLDCSELPALREQVVINSDCGKPPSEQFKCSAVDDEECDWKCRTLDKIKELWRKLKESVNAKVKDWELEETMLNVQDWFHNAFNRIKTTVNNNM